MTEGKTGWAGVVLAHVLLAMPVIALVLKVLGYFPHR
ncbi:hypothetical protein tf_03 [Pseudomonas phage tf]|uniref:Uncharacterized protein n=1 Tax=Pseudomonas phage tf TaxID=1114179 RepID=J7RUM0_9CAUD|nr:hypothetical protein tf_03 [Pseudomonas phage tf]CCL97934.1 hypothetical protein tf_03 [Pseudomonas phage tf]